MTRIESEVLQQQLGAHDTDGVVIKSHTDAVWDADEIGRVDIHLTIHLRLAGGTTDREVALAIALQTYQLVGNEAIDQRKRQTGHLEVGIDIPLTLVLIDTTEQTELHIVEHQTGLHSMGVVLLHQINQLSTDITNGRSFIGHVAHTHITGHRDMLVLILHDMVVAVKLTGDTGQIRNHGGHLAQVELIDTQRDIL